MALLVRKTVWPLLIVALLASMAGAQENLAPNPSFEEGEGPHPDHWSVADPGPHARAEWSTEAHTGERSLAASVEETAGFVWWNSELITVRPGQTYTLSVWYRCTNPDGGPPTPQIQAADGANLIDWNLPVRTSWSEFTQSFTLGPDDTQIRIALINYHRAGQGIYWDDIRLWQIFGAAGAQAGREVLVALVDAAQTAVAERPYELGDRKRDFPPSVMFSDLSGWTMRLSPGMEGTAAVSAQQRIWGRRCLRVNYHWTAPPGDPFLSTSGRLAQTSGGGSLEIVPPEPIAIGGPSDAVQLWVNADNYYSPHRPRATVRLLDGDGRAIDVCLGPVNWMYWFLMYAPILQGLKPPVRFERIILSNITNTRPLDIYFDALAFIQAPKGPLEFRQWTEPLPFPTRAETILPSVRLPVQNGVRQEGEAFLLDCATPDGPVTYRYEPKTGTLSDVSAMVPDEGEWQPLSGGGPVIVDKGPIDGQEVLARLVSAQIQGQAVVSVWHVTGGAEPLTLTYTLRTRGKTLVIDVKADRPMVSSFSAGRVVGARDPRVLWVPYANATRWPQPHVLITEKHFASIYFDWYTTDSSAFYGAGNVSDTGAQIFDRADYLADLDGVRNVLGERVFLTISNHFDEVLWNIPNPPSPLKGILRTNVFVSRMHYGGGAADYDSEFAFWKHLNSYGVDHLTIRLHADFWRSRESFTLKDQAAPAKGGDEVAKRYLHNVSSLGYRVGLYTDYLLISPLSEAWNPDMAALGSDGDRAEQAFATYFLKPSRAAELEAEWAPRIHAKFNTSASYCDQLTQANPSWIEFDPRVPGATKQRTVLESYGRLLLNERVAHGGPCYSEGGYHAVWAGLCDGSYAQTFQPDAPPVPDFALRKIHPLEADVGYDLPWLAKKSTDHLLAMQIVYGNGGMFWGGVFGADLPSINVPELLRSYFMMQQLQCRYTMEPVETIQYFDGARWMDTDEALRTDAHKRGQVLTRYCNGLVVAVNASQERDLTVSLGNRRFVLPPYGWAARDGAGFLEYSALFNGKRRDFVGSDEYVYFDGRGNTGNEGGIEASGQVIALRRAGALRVIPVDPKTPVRLKLRSLGVTRSAQVKLLYTTETGKTVSEKRQSWPRDGWLALRWPRGAFAAGISGL